MGGGESGTMAGGKARPVVAKDLCKLERHDPGVADSGRGESCEHLAGLAFADLGEVEVNQRRLE